MRTFIYLGVICTLFFSGCSSRVDVVALEPAKVERASSAKKVAVMPFENDNIGLSYKVETKIASKMVDAKPYFTAISRKDIDKIIEEQKLQYSGLVDESSAVKLGALVGSQSIISGNVSSASESSSRYHEERSACADKKCTKMYLYNVPCIQKVFTVAAQMKMVDVQKGDIIYGDTFQKSAIYEKCSDDYRAMPSRDQVLETLSDDISDEFVNALSPNYRSFSVVLLEDEDIDYTNEQEEMLEHALIYIERNRYEKAQELLSTLLNSTKDKSYVAAYNLAVVKEILGEYDHAKELYLLADSLTSEPVEEIDEAVLRIETLLQNRKILDTQNATQDHK